MDIFSNLMVIGECLLDVRRTLAFKRAIEKTVKSGDTVLDVGTGSGILAMFSAKAGAKKVFAVEIDKDISKFASDNIATNKLDQKIAVINSDVRDISFAEPVDVVTMELMDTGLVGEHQGVAINALHKKGIITQKTKLIPYRFQCVAILADYDFSFYGLQMPFVVQARNFSTLKKVNKYLSNNFIYEDIDFRLPVNTDIDKKISIKINQNGSINALVLKSRIFLSPGQNLWGTTDMNMPVIVPIKKREVRKGQTVKIYIKYKMGEGFGQFKVGYV